MVSLLSYLLTITLSLTGIAVLPVLAAPLPQEVVATSTVSVTSVAPVTTATPLPVVITFSGSPFTIFSGLDTAALANSAAIDVEMSH